MTKDVNAHVNTSPSERNLPDQPYLAGFWLVAALPLTVLIMLPLNAWMHRQEVEDMIGIPLIMLALLIS